jgi:glutamate synthase domain-containing protein 1
MSIGGYAAGRYDPRFEHDACGIGFVVQLSGVPSHAVLAQALTAVGNMAHRGGVHADGRSGDGAGVLTALPRAFFARELARRGLPDPGDRLAVGMVFLPAEIGTQATGAHLVAEGLAEAGLQLLGWRDVPIDPAVLGAQARGSCPCIRQALVAPAPGRDLAGEAYERALYLARRAIEAAATAQGLAGFAIPSLSHRTIVYKGLLVAPLLADFYPDLADPLFQTPLADFHQR